MNGSTNNKKTQKKLTKQERIELIAKRVWELWREDLRRETERRDSGRRR